MKIEILPGKTIRFKTKEIKTDGDKEALCDLFMLMMNDLCTEQYWENSDIDLIIETLPKTIPITAKACESRIATGQPRNDIVFEFSGKSCVMGRCS